MHTSIVIGFMLLLTSCTPNPSPSNRARHDTNQSGTVTEVDGRDKLPASEPKMTEEMSAEDELFRQHRVRMVETQIRRRGIEDERVLEAMTRIPRHLFVPQNLRSQAYNDGPLPIGYGQTISQPYIVALMTELVRTQPGDRALDIGTGCGYQAAVLSGLVQQIYSLEIVEPLANQARSRLSQYGYRNVEVRAGDGYQGWEEHAPFQIIIVAAAPDHVPQPLLDQLAPGGRMVIPVGRFSQELLLLEKSQDGSIQRTEIAPVAFVPMTGTAETK